MTTRVKMTYAYPERIVQVQDESGKLVWAREPGSPTREARSTDLSTWYEDQLSEACIDSLCADFDADSWNSADDDDYLLTHAYA
jgi:hypothetical protein